MSYSGAVPRRSNVTFDVSPGWAEDAVKLTSASLEISFDRLRETYDNSGEGGRRSREGHCQAVNITIVPCFTGDIDSRSIKDQDHTKRLWEAKLAEGDVKLYPDHKPEDNRQITTPDKQHISITKVVTVSQSDNRHDTESAIDREIRLTEQREAEIRREKEERQRELDQKQTDAKMTIYKVPPPVHVNTSITVAKVNDDVPPLPTSPIPVYKPDSGHDMGVKTESIIDREIRLQEEREESIRRAGYIKSIQIDKEAEQSEFERREKEHEKVQAHESIVDREIRLTQDRERELQQLRRSVSSSVSDTLHSPQIPTSPPPTITPQPQQPTTPQPQHPTTPQLQPVMMAASPEPQHVHIHVESAVSYESAINKTAHQGESIIARELREQREREEELRGRYKEMGLDRLLVDQDPPDTPYNAPEPSQPNISKLPARAKATLKTNQPRTMSRSISEPVHIATHVEPPKSAVNHVEPARMPTSFSQDTLSKQTIAEEPHGSHNMLPHEETDGFDVSYRFVPQNETPIEREMRLSREREEELRQSRGFPLPKRDPNAVIEIQEMKSPTPKPQVVYKKGDEGDGKLMQKLASSRLQVEIEKEKRREQDLKSQGTITTISSERPSGQIRYVDVIPKDNIDAKKVPNWKVQNVAIVRTVSPAPSVDSVDASSPQPPLEHNGSPAQQQMDTLGRSRAEPAIARRYSSHTQQLILTETDKYRQRPTPTVAESRIERELREMKEREEELRYNPGGYSDDLRRSISVTQSESMDDLSENPSNGHRNDVTSPVMHTDETHTQSSNPSNVVKSNRRKSALAEEWEKKFGANT